jgi:hypothetical protein
MHHRNGDHDFTADQAPLTEERRSVEEQLTQQQQPMPAALFSELSGLEQPLRGGNLV